MTKTKQKLKKNLKHTIYSNRVTEIQCRILEELARYFYLTNSQMLHIWVGTVSSNYLWEHLRSLAGRKKPLIYSKGYDKPAPLKGRVENLYRLTPRGMEYVINELRYQRDMVKYAKSWNAFPYRDYYHRTWQVSFMIELYKWVERQWLDIPFFHCDFDKFGSNRGGSGIYLTSKTRIDFRGTYMTPDGIFSIIDDNYNESYFVLEYFADRDNKRIMKKLDVHANAMVFRAIHEKYGWPKDKSYKVLSFFRYKASMLAVQEKLKLNPAYQSVADYFLFKSIEELAQEWSDLSFRSNINSSFVPLITR